jgi:hypothetical protein
MHHVFLVISSSKTNFVRNYCLESIKLCGIPEDKIFVTLDDHDDKLIYGNRILVTKKDFIGAVIEACDYLENINISNLILILDDFIFKSISKDLDNFIYNHCLTKPYVRLTPIEYVWLYNKSNIFPIPQNHPYYSSLQVAFWSRDYLKQSVMLVDNIWSLEKIHVGQTHYSVKNKLVNYKHIVEKGKWDHRVKKILKQRGLTFNFNGVKFYKISTLTKIKNIIVMKIILPFFGYRLLK